MQHQVLQHRPFARAYIQRLAVGRHLVRGSIQGNRPECQHRGRCRLRTTQQGTQTRQQLGQLERLDHVVIRPRIQALHPVLQGITRRQHQHRHGLAALAHALGQLHAIHAGQPHVDDGGIERVGRHGVQGRFGTAHRIHHIAACGRQALLDTVGQHLVIFYQQQSHGRAPRSVSMAFHYGACRH